MKHEISNFYTTQCDAKILGASITEEGLAVEFSNDQGTHVYSWFWVRDHCIDSESLDQQTTQRKVDTFAIAHGLSCTKLDLIKPKQVIHLEWSDNSQSTISAYMLASVKGLTPHHHELTPNKPQVLWDKASPLHELPRIDFEKAIETDSGLLEWLQNIHTYGFSLVDNVPATTQGTEQLALRLGVVQETIFGRMWPLSSQVTEHEDTAYTNSYLEPHTDGTYYRDAAGLQMFNCLDINCEGGESIQLDGFALANKIKQEDPEAYQTLTEVVIPGHYIEHGVHLRAERPAFQLDSKGDLIQVSFNNYDRAPMCLDEETYQRFHHAYKLLHDHIIDQENWITIEMKQGTALIFDNWRNLHGRMSYVGDRYFYGCYHSKAVFESKLRVLQRSLV